MTIIVSLDSGPTRASYFTQPANLEPLTKVRSGDINNLAAAVQTGFQSIPATSQNWSGIQDYSAGSLRAKLPTSASEVATRGYVDNLALKAVLPPQALGFVRSNGSTFDFSPTHTGYAQNEVKAPDIASAATLNLTAPGGNFIHITGTTGISAITVPAGAERTLVFDSALMLTHSAALLLPGAVSIVTQPGDRALVRGDTNGAIVTHYQRADGTPLASLPQAIVLLASATITTPVANIDFLTTFTSAYDTYVVEVAGILVSSAAGLNVFMAKNGVVDNSAVYYPPVQDGGTGTFGATSLYVPVTIPSAGNAFALAATMKFRNTNSNTLLKGFAVQGFSNGGAVIREGGYYGTNAVSGFRLAPNGAVNFTAGTIRVYGIKNS